MWLVLATASVLCIGCWAQSGYIPTGYEEVTQKSEEGYGAIEKCGEGSQEGRYICVPYHRCDGITNTVISDEPEQHNTNGFGIIDIRFGANACQQPLDVCCKKAGQSNDTNASTSTTTTVTPPTPPSPTPPRESFCGIRNQNGVDFKITGNTDNEAEYGEFPWMLALLHKNYNPQQNETLAICGGSLLTPNVVLTGAHCVYKYKVGDLKVRAGEWDTQTTHERLPYQERDVVDIIIHEKFKPQTLFNDVALLILDRSFKKAEHISTICLPPQNTVIRSENCFASGWGKNIFGKEGIYQVILKKIELPMVDHSTCQTELRKTRLGTNFVLDRSFTCAGGQYGKDTCTGDGGSPLVCPDPNNPKRYVQTGIVAWGIGCGENIPGVYVDVSKFRDWIDENLQRLRINNKPYTI